MTRHYHNSFFDAFFNAYCRDERMRLAVLLNEIEYHQAEIVEQICDGMPDESLSLEEIKQLRRAITLLEEKLSRDSLKHMPAWFWEDQRFYASATEPDFVVDDDSPWLRQRLMDTMFDEASNNFLQRNTFFHKHSLELV